MLDTLPPEIFGRVLEIAIEIWGIGFLPPVRLVSRTCNDVVASTPSLWGIITLGRPFDLTVLQKQLERAKQSDIRLSYPRKGFPMREKRFVRLFDQLLTLTDNWIRAELTTELLAKTHASRLPRLSSLDVRGNLELLPESFFDSRLPTLHSLSLSHLTEMDGWRTGFFSPHITDFTLGFCAPRSTTLIRQALSLLPNLYSLHFENLAFYHVFTAQSPIKLAALHHLEVINCLHATGLLLEICAPNLRVLSIRGASTNIEMALILADWSQPTCIPTHLQSLELWDVLKGSDSAYLVRYIERLPSLIRLMVSHNDLDGLDEFEVLVHALAKPEVCPMLEHLCLDIPLHTVDAISIAKLRRKRLRSVQIQLCAGGTQEEADEFRSYFACDVRCMCLSCSFN